MATTRPKNWRYDPWAITAPIHTRAMFLPKDFRKLVARCARALPILNAAYPFQALAACGQSGVLLAAALSLRLDLPLAIIRKAGEPPGHGNAVTGLIRVPTLLVDDLICTGATIQHTKAQLHEVYSHLVGVLLYKSRWDPTDTPFKPTVPVFFLDDLVGV